MSSVGRKVEGSARKMGTAEPSVTTMPTPATHFRAMSQSRARP